MSPYFCGMAAIPVCPENPGLPRGGRVWWRVLHIMLYLRHPAAVVSYPPSFPIRRCSRLLPSSGRRRFLSAAVSCPPLSPGLCRLLSAMPPGKNRLPALARAPGVSASPCTSPCFGCCSPRSARARRAGRNARIGRDRPLAARIEILRMQPVAFGDGACELFVEFL